MKTTFIEFAHHISLGVAVIMFLITLVLIAGIIQGAIDHEIPPDK